MKKSNFEAVSFFRYRYKQLFKGVCYIDVIDTSLLHKQEQTMVFSEEDKSFYQVLRHERVMVK